MIRAWLLPVVASAISLSTAPALATPPSGEDRGRAAESFREAQAAFGRRDFAAAAAAFEAAAEFASHPAALLSAAEAWRRAGEPARAAGDCDRARSMATVAEASAADHVDYAHDARQCLDELRGHVALLDVRGGGAVAARLDDGQKQVLPARFWVRPGHHVLTVIDLASSNTLREELDVAAGEERRVDLTAGPPQGQAAAPPPAPRPAPSVPLSSTVPAVVPDGPHHPVPTASWIAFGVAAPVAVAYGVLAAVTVQAKSNFDATPSDDTKNAFYRDRTLADVAFGVAAAALATGVVFWLVSPATASASALLPGGVRF
jgi:hypothetical protein